MKTMKRVAGLGAAIALAGVCGQAAAYSIVPGDADAITNTNSNLGNWAEIYTAFGLKTPPYPASDTVFQLYYKANTGGSEDGTYQSSYSTTFANTSDDPQEATVVYVSSPTIDCPDCFLLVKDGNTTPAQYLFDIGDWNGTDSLVLTGFWPEQGAISNVAIWGLVAADDDGDDDTPGDDDVTIPEPSTVLLFGAGLLGAGLARTRRRRG